MAGRVFATFRAPSWNRIESSLAMVKLYQLVQLIAIAEHDTLRSAAEALYISEPALSRNLGKLESELGCPLFERTPRGLVLNEFGEIALERARAAIRETELMREEIESLRRERSQVIRLASCHGDFCACAGDYFARNHPDRLFQSLVAPNAKALEAMIRTGDCDIALPTARTSGLSFVDESAVKIYDEQVMVIAPAELAADMPGQVGLDDIRDLRFVLPRGRGRGIYGWNEHIVEAARVPAEQVEYVDVDYYMRHINDIDGFSLATTTLLSFLKHDNRKVISIDDPCAHEEIFMLICSDDEFVVQIAHVLQEECGKGSGMNYFLGWISSGVHSANLEIVDGRR